MHHTQNVSEVCGRILPMQGNPPIACGTIFVNADFLESATDALAGTAHLFSSGR
jgi:hypothetical protein